MIAFYRHKKRGTRYTAIDGNVLVQCDTPLQDGETVLLYRDLDSGKHAIRRESEFQDGRFELVTE